jgi:hypothetical protein
VLIRYSSVISRKLYPSDKAHPFQIDFSELKWLDMAIRIIGITILVFLIPSRVSAIFQSIFTQTLDSAPDYMKNAARIDVWIFGSQIVLYIFLGFLFVFKSKSITNFLRKKEVD